VKGRKGKGREGKGIDKIKLDLELEFK